MSTGRWPETQPWALGRIPGPEAEQALTDLLDSDSEIVRQEAKALLARRAGQ